MKAKVLSPTKTVMWPWWSQKSNQVSLPPKFMLSLVKSNPILKLKKLATQKMDDRTQGRMPISSSPTTVPCGPTAPPGGISGNFFLVKG